jgi:hypothetical protein
MKGGKEGERNEGLYNISLSFINFIIIYQSIISINIIHIIVGYQ